MRTLPDKYDEAHYNEFIKFFGTHYVWFVEMGSRLGLYSEITSDGWSIFSENNFRFDIGAGFSAMGFGASFEIMTDS